MSPSLLRLLLLAAAAWGVAQTRHMPGKDLVKQQVTSLTSSLRVARNDSSYFGNNTNNNVTSSILAITNANNNNNNSSNVSTEYASADHPPPTKQTNMQFEDNDNGAGNTVSISTPKSVVENWSLVCQQLCGAGLGGAPCATHCQSSDKPSPLPHFKENNQTICKDLCRLQLGDASCNCTFEELAIINATMTYENELHNAVCNSFCEHNGATLTGCSDCTNKINVEISMKVAVESTTPNWKELCVELCKTGDGGSLCNCNLAPFF
ncbi:unnamed protein product [Ceratitis capitata]|uniref:(Mediterranean fruit fly) hypothetical protein n=1 Tax=Ceratitis capitata TaxID=7213 RepID=A0A811UU46_CERCA|nr:unnamed protein product [Ceratitis capitata]